MEVLFQIVNELDRNRREISLIFRFLKSSPNSTHERPALGSSVAEKHFELLFSAGNSDTVYIRPSKIPYLRLNFIESLYGSRHEPQKTEPFALQSVPGDKDGGIWS